MTLTTVDPWCTAAQVKSRTEAAGLDDDKAATAAQVGSELLSLLSGSRYWLQTRTVRPEGCGRRGEWDSREVVGWGMPIELTDWLGPRIDAGPAGGVAVACGGCSRWSTGGILLAGPVVWDDTHPIEVTVDGVVLDAGSWVIVGGQTLVRTDGKVFPQCQDLSVADDQPGTCKVTYTRGVAPPQSGVQAAISLAVEWAKLPDVGYITGADLECRLPQRLQTITRQGVTATVADNIAIIKDGGTGLTDVDLFIRAVNPYGVRSGGVVVTPGFEDEDVTVIAGSQGAFT